MSPFLGLVVSQANNAYAPQTLASGWRSLGIPLAAAGRHDPLDRQDTVSLMVCRAMDVLT